MLLLIQLPPGAAVGILAALTILGIVALALCAVAKAVAQDQRD